MKKEGAYPIVRFTAGIYTKLIRPKSFPPTAHVAARERQVQRAIMASWPVGLFANVRHAAPTYPIDQSLARFLRLATKFIGPVLCSMPQPLIPQRKFINVILRRPARQFPLRSLVHPLTQEACRFFLSLRRR